MGWSETAALPKHFCENAVFPAAMARQFLVLAPVNSRFVISREILYPDRDWQPIDLTARFPAPHVHGMQPGRQIDSCWHAP
jgi:hypothetical protein